MLLHNILSLSVHNADECKCVSVRLFRYCTTLHCKYPESHLFSIVVKLRYFEVFKIKCKIQMKFFIPRSITMELNFAIQLEIRKIDD